MFFLTIGDAYSGVYNSQVIDVVHYLKNNGAPRVRLVSFQSPRIFLSERNQILQSCKNSIVLPSFPRLANWKMNIPALSLIIRLKRPQQIIARGVFATNLALEMRKKGLVERVIYDGRGATSAEWEEYGFGQGTGLTQKVTDLEFNAVRESDMRIAVSKKLVCYWQDKFNYREAAREIIPCLLSDKFFETALKSRLRRTELRENLGYTEESIVLVFSGGTGEWQSARLLADKLHQFLDSDTRIHVLLLTKSNKHLDSILEHHSERVQFRWVAPDLVPNYLAVADYGLLIREQSITNSVAAPTKFAEYLGLGLKVLISANVGDYSNFVLKYDCGHVLDDKVLPAVKKTNKVENDRLIDLAKKMFTKNCYKENYARVLLSE